jgi:hypothetical protein
MSKLPDLPLEAFYLQRDAHWRISEQEAVAKLLAKFPDSSMTQLENAVTQARRFRRAAARCDVFHEPTAAAATKAAMAHLQREAPGLSELAYSAALHPILYSWMK